jgi:hypothetical protein
VQALQLDVAQDVTGLGIVNGGIGERLTGS